MLQSVAQVRNWVVTHLPIAESLVGYDLFLKLGNDIAAGLPLEVQRLAAGLPYEPGQIIGQLQLMAQAGLLEFAGEPPAPRVVRPTARFVDLLAEYGRTFDRLFIVRDDLRGQQLVATATDPALKAFGKLVYDRVHDLGWLYLHNFGSVCFLMASLVRRIAEAHGHAARISSCYVEIVEPQRRFQLGGQGLGQPGQVDGHAACVVGEALVLDFGLGNVRKAFRRDFPWGVVCDYRRDGAVFGSAPVPGNGTAIWKDDWQSASTETELAACVPFVERLFREYEERFL
jgi:hypothetical protein